MILSRKRITHKKKGKNRKLPPIVVHGNVTNHGEFVKLILGIVKNKFHIKYNQKTTEIVTYIEEDYNKLIEALKIQNIKFHTYTSK